MAGSSPDSPLFIRLYLDEDVHKRVASALRLRGFDVISAHEVGRQAFNDEEQLRFATAEGRALFTYNAADYLRLHVEWLQRGEEHGGIIVSDQASLGEIIRRLLNLLNCLAADEVRSQIFWLQAFRRY